MFELFRKRFLAAVQHRMVSLCIIFDKSQCFRVNPEIVTVCTVQVTFSNFRLFSPPHLTWAFRSHCARLANEKGSLARSVFFFFFYKYNPHPYLDKSRPPRRAVRNPPIRVRVLKSCPILMFDVEGCRDAGGRKRGQLPGSPRNQYGVQRWLKCTKPDGFCLFVLWRCFCFAFPFHTVCLLTPPSYNYFVRVVIGSARSRLEQEVCTSVELN